MKKTKPDEILMLKSFSTSVTGKLVSITYTLKVFVKHDSWNEFGEGKVVSCPIRIVQAPVEIISDLSVTPPPGWNP